MEITHLQDFRCHVLGLAIVLASGPVLWHAAAMAILYFTVYEGYSPSCACIQSRSFRITSKPRLQVPRYFGASSS